MKTQLDSIWDRAVDTLASACIDYKMGKIDKETFLLALKIYAKQMEELLKE